MIKKEKLISYKHSLKWKSTYFSIIRWLIMTFSSHNNFFISEAYSEPCEKHHLPCSIQLWSFDGKSWVDTIMQTEPFEQCWFRRYIPNWRGYITKPLLRHSNFSNYDCLAQAYSEPCQASKIVRFAKIVNGLKAVNHFRKTLYLRGSALTTPLFGNSSCIFYLWF